MDDLKLWLAISAVLVFQVFIMFNQYCIFTRMIEIRQTFGGLFL